MDFGVYVWVDGSYQNVGRSTAEGAQYLRDTSIDGGADATPGGDYEDSVDVGALGFGTKWNFQGLQLVAAGFWNQGLGIQFQGNLKQRLPWIIRSEVKLETFMVVIYKLLMTSVKVLT